MVRLAGGIPHVAKGTVTQAFLQEIAATCARHGVSRGAVRGVANGRLIHLTFSHGVPGPCRQQLRNLWVLSGWSAGHSGAGAEVGPSSGYRPDSCENIL